MSTSLTAVLQEVLRNTTNLTALKQLMTPDATYVSLNVDNAELKRVMPWAGTHHGPQALPEVFEAIQRCWKTLDFQVTDAVEQGSRVALFGSFTTNRMSPAGKSCLPSACWRVSRATRSPTFSF